MNCIFVILWLIHITSAIPLVSRANPQFPDPNIDPFYKVPANIGKYKPGQVIRHRTVPTEIVGLYSASYQIFFRTTNNFNKPIGTVVTVWVPTIPASPPKIFAYQYAEDADNLDCCPSWAWIKNSGSNSQLSEREVQGPVLIPWGVQNGYYVISTDAEGPDSTWLVGRTEGRAVLDAIRATSSFLSLVKPKVALYGYSGGAHTSVWACTEAESYAPELDIVGAAYGGTPVDLRAAFNLDNGTPSSLVIGAAIFGLANGYPQLNELVNKRLTPEGKKIGQDFRARNNCTSYAQTGYSGTSFNYSTIFTTNVVNGAVINHIFREESLLSNVSSSKVPVPKFPRYEYHGTSDTTVPYAPEYEYIEQQCAKGANIQFTPYTGLDHAPTAVAGLGGALNFIQQSFAGTTPSVVCGQSANATALTTEEVLGPALAEKWAKLSSKM